MTSGDDPREEGQPFQFGAALQADSDKEKSMSGGSWDYVCNRVGDAAERLSKSECPYRRALGEYLRPAAKALKAVEWVDSNDWGPPDDINAIKECLQGRLISSSVDSLTTKLETIASDLGSVIELLIECQQEKESDGE